MTDSTGAEAISISKNIQRLFVKNKLKTPTTEMKPVVADEMFPEGIDIEEVSIQLERCEKNWLFTFENFLKKTCFSRAGTQV